MTDNQDMKNAFKQKHFSLNGESSVIKVLRKIFFKTLLLFLFVCILAGFAFGRRMQDEHTPLKAFFFSTNTTTKFLFGIFIYSLNLERKYKKQKTNKILKKFVRVVSEVYKKTAKSPNFE